MIDKNKLLAMLKSGCTLQETADAFGVSRQRVWQLAKKLDPELTREGFGAGLKFRNRLKAQLEHCQKTYGRDKYHYAADLDRAQGASFTRKKQNVRRIGRKKIPFEVSKSDIEWPTVCPVLGIELDWFAAERKENSPSFDRVDPSKGYVKGNVKIISWRANRIKNDGTAEEHEAIAKYIRECS